MSTSHAGGQTLIVDPTQLTRLAGGAAGGAAIGRRLAALALVGGADSDGGGVTFVAVGLAVAAAHRVGDVGTGVGARHAGAGAVGPVAHLSRREVAVLVGGALAADLAAAALRVGRRAEAA